MRDFVGVLTLTVLPCGVFPCARTVIVYVDGGGGGGAEGVFL